MIRHARALTRITLIMLSLLVLLPFWLLTRLITAGSPRLQRTSRDAWTRGWSRLAARFIGLRITISGTPPDPPFCLVSNHLSYLDAIVISAHAPGLMIAKSEVASWPLIGWLSTQIGTIFIDRKTSKDVMRVNDIIKKTLLDGNGVTFFPEGTTSDGQAVGRFHSSLLNYPASVSYPVHYATLRYESDHGNVVNDVCWWGDMTFGAHFYRMSQLPRIKAKIHFCTDPVTNPDRKELTGMLRSGVAQHFLPIS